MQVLDAADVTEIFVQWYGGAPKADVARRLGVDRKTVRRYVRVAETEGWQPGGRPASRAEWDAFVARWFPTVRDVRLRQRTWPEIDGHHSRIAALMTTTPVAAIHRRLREEHGLTASLASLHRYVRAHFPEPR